MFDYLWMACKGSDYTVVIAVLHWPKCIILVLKLTLVLELWVLFSSHQLPLLKQSLRLSLALKLSGNAHEGSDYTAMNAVMHWCMGAETHPGGEVVIAVMIFLSSFWPLLLTRFEQHGRHVWCALIGTRCKLDAYVIWTAFEWGLNTSWCRQKLPRYPRRQSRALLPGVQLPLAPRGNFMK